jgi:serine/threonine protein kinase
MKPGTLIGGKYRLVRPLGEGGMGVVWAALNELTEREVALKLIRGLDAANDDARHRLLREARACGRIVHRNVVEVYDVGQTDAGDPFLVMELLNGETVSERLHRERRLAPDAALRLAAEVARGLRAAHMARVIHRDLKPSNLFLHEEPGASAPVLKILDFGVSKTLQADSSFTATGKTMGSPAYMSPEQVRGLKSVDHRTDLWSFGAAAEVLTGHIRSLSELLPSADPRIGGIVDRCLQRDVSQRFSSAEEVLDAIMQLLGDERSGVLSPATRAAALAVMPSAPPLPIIVGADAGSGERITPTEFAPPPVPHTDLPPFVSKEERDTIRPTPASLPPMGPHGLPVLNRDSAVDSEEMNRAEPPPPRARVTPAVPPPPNTPPQVVLWDEYVRRRAAEPDPAAPQHSDALASSRSGPAPRALFMMAIAALLLVVGIVVFIVALR